MPVGRFSKGGPGRVPAVLFRRRMVILPDYEWPRMAGILGRPELATAPGYRSRAERSEHGEELHGLMEAWVRSHTIDEIETVLDEAGIAFGRVRTVADLLKDPILRDRGVITELDHYGEVLPLFGPFPILSDSDTLPEAGPA